MSSVPIKQWDELVRYFPAYAGMSAEDRVKIETVLKEYEVRFSRYLLELCARSEAVARQFLPDPRELDTRGVRFTWEGVMATGVPGLERMYLDRVVVLPVNQCPAYCRFCFRKNYFNAYAKQPLAMAESHVERAVAYIASDPRIREALVTGGDPLMNMVRLHDLLRRLREIPHVGVIRVASRSVAYDPERITNELAAMLSAYNRPEEGKAVEIATHFNHPDEITSESTGAVTRLLRAGLRVYNQTVLLKGINDEVGTLEALFRGLHERGVEMYYLFHCEPLLGAAHFRTTIERGLQLRAELRSRASGRIIPRYMVCTQLGKVELGVDGWITERNEEACWIRTPYRLETFR
ncbi:MAG: radical SAM protein, partial [Patescibacteria group bacterium]